MRIELTEEQAPDWAAYGEVSITAGIDMLENRRDLAVLWDLRVNPAWRGRQLRRVNPAAYPTLRGEVQFLWYKPLVG